MKVLSQKKYVLILIILLTIGFAAVTTTLLIRGNVGIGLKEKDFDVYFSNVYLNDVKHNEFISSDGKTITFATEKLIDVGDQAILRYEIMNSSTQYDATIDLKFNKEEIENEYISVEMEQEYDDDLIKASDKGTGSIIITLKQAALEEKSIDFKVSMDANATSVDSTKDPDTTIKTEKPGDNILTGTITDEDGNPIKNKPVVIISGNGIHYTETDLEGNICADDLAEGTQDIYIFDNHTLEEVKKMTEEEIKKYATRKITITTSTSGNAKGDNCQIKNTEFEKTETIDKVTIKIGDKIIDKVLKDGDTIEFNVDTNEKEIEISGLGKKELKPGENRFEITLENGEKVTVIVNNVRPTPPILTGGNTEYVNDKKATISLKESGTSLSDIEYYEYYISDTIVSDFSNITPTGTTENELEITKEGTTYVYYRTVSKNGTISNWSEPLVVKLDYSPPTVGIISVTPSSNKIAIKFNAKDTYSGIKTTTCELGEANNFTEKGTIENGTCTFSGLASNKVYNYLVCAEDNAGNEQVCKIGEAITNEVSNPVIGFDNNESASGEYYLGQTAKVSFDGTGIENPKLYIKSTRKGISNINLTRSCGSGDAPDVCTDITPTTTVSKDVWYEVSGSINVSYTEASDEYSQIIAIVYDGYNYSNKTTGTIGKIAYAAIDLEYTNPLAPNVTNVQEAIDDLYKRLR